ncbi:MAG: hypothetical protein QM209_06340 [Candidatus Cloacimonadota bacterium]|jgi:hypothetical protein|nr:hypothetical protein [Candidatus Cloacimonas sp.]MDD3605831.1 hypothetical protein [Candidatus Cloacimonas acidaminovorans]MDI9572786.1 hypothetical protein [Candidatus Cloacimonadota bacterium]OQC71768.1 MAG: hypothetical protein BWX46_00530 [Candidatus Cloacimonetes bacterium ADurb.Bin003]NLM91072.1 hypothetical protein [Candidatus Cloacimonadota bacterium]
MKVNFKYGIKTYSGTMDEVTYGSYRKNTICIGRKYVKPRLTDQNALVGGKMKNLAIIYNDVSESYKQELKQYALLNEVNVPKGKLLPNAYALWVKMMFKFADADAEHIDLTTLTYSDLQTVGDEILSISSAVENGYMDNVPGADKLTANM